MTIESREQDPGSARASRKSRGSPAIIEAGGSGGLDTSGFVPDLSPSAPRVNGEPSGYSWETLPNDFVRGYIGALFASEGMRLRHLGEAWKHKLVTGFSDLAPETLARIIADCAEFHQSQAWRGYVSGALSDPGIIDPERCGQMFWKERQGIPGGFIGAFSFPQEYAQRLHERAEIFPPLTPYLGDDGRVYLREQS